MDNRQVPCFHELISSVLVALAPVTDGAQLAHHAYGNGGSYPLCKGRWQFLHTGWFHPPGGRCPAISAALLGVLDSILTLPIVMSEPFVIMSRNTVMLDGTHRQSYWRAVGMLPTPSPRSSMGGSHPVWSNRGSALPTCSGQVLTATR